MVSGMTLLGYAWFLLRYQSAAQGGDLIKATYLLQVFPPLALLAGSFIDRLWDRRPKVWTAAGAALCCIFVVEIPAFVTHYVHLSASTGMIAFLLSTLFFAAGLLITYWIHTRYYLDIVVEPAAPPADGPLISVCVPARNEEANIRACVEAVLAQTYPHIELIVLDDRSTDATPDILRELAADKRLRVLHGAELPDGWAGKPHALVQAAAAANGEWLCFLDADTFLAPQALAGCYARALATHADLFTIMTQQVMGTFWEKVVMPLVMSALSVGFPPREANDPNSRVAIANGQFIMIKRDVYAAVGGHERIKDQIVEDKALAEAVKWNGYRLIVADGRLAARTRMYTSLPQMWEGWTKNIYLGLQAQTNLLLLGAFGALILACGRPLPARLARARSHLVPERRRLDGARRHRRGCHPMGMPAVCRAPGRAWYRHSSLVCADNPAGSGDIRGDDVHIGLEGNVWTGRYVAGPQVQPGALITSVRGIGYIRQFSSSYRTPNM